MLGEQAVFILTKEDNPAYKKGCIDETFIRQQVSDFQRHFYVCGPDAMISDIRAVLERSGANPDAIVFEK